MTIKSHGVEPPAEPSTRRRRAEKSGAPQAREIFQELLLLQPAATIAASLSVPRKQQLSASMHDRQANTVHTARSAGGGEKGAHWAAGGGLLHGTRRRFDALGHGLAHLHLQGRVNRLQAKD